MTSFSPGDLVQLKSGGPKMVVSRILDDEPKGVDALHRAAEGVRAGDVVCIWFDGAKKETGLFRRETIGPIEGDAE